MRGARPATARRVPVALVALAALLLAGCGDGSEEDAPERGDVASALVERERLSRAEADCVTDYLFEDWGEAQLRRFLDDGILGLSPREWEGYPQAMLACVHGDDLGVERSGGQGP